MVGVNGPLSPVVTHPLGIAGATELRIGREDAGRELDGHLRHLAHFPRRLEDEVLRQVASAMDGLWRHLETNSVSDGAGPASSERQRATSAVGQVIGSRGRGGRRSPPKRAPRP